MEMLLRLSENVLIDSRQLLHAALRSGTRRDYHDTCRSSPVAGSATGVPYGNELSLRCRGIDSSTLSAASHFQRDDGTRSVI